MIGYGRRRYGLLEGDLVQVKGFMRIRDPKTNTVSTPTDWSPGIILRIYDSNVYEGVSADVLVGEAVVWCETKNISILERVDA